MPALRAELFPTMMLAELYFRFVRISRTRFVQVSRKRNDIWSLHANRVQAIDYTLATRSCIAEHRKNISQTGLSLGTSSKSHPYKFISPRRLRTRTAFAPPPVSNLIQATEMAVMALCSVRTALCLVEPGARATLANPMKQ